jgi:hypothetical protein
MVNLDLPESLKADSKLRLRLVEKLDIELDC